jgi:hypothetical protein
MARKASRVEHGLRSPVSQEIASLTLAHGGTGNFILATPVRADGYRWVSHEAGDAIVRAAHRLGPFDDSDGVGEGWMAVALMLAAGCLPDLLSEAIEEQEDEYAVRAR